MTTHTQYQFPPSRALVTGSETVRPSLPGAGSAAAAAGSVQWADEVLAEAAPALAGVLAEVRMLRRGPERLALLKLSSGRELVLKQYSDDRGAWTRRWLQQLAEEGFAPPAKFAVTRERGWSASHRTLVTDLADGKNWVHWLQAPPAGRDTAAVAAADWLVRLQSLQVTLPDRTAHRAGDELCRQSGLLADRYPLDARRLLQIREAVHRCLYHPRRAPVAGLVASHGDLHPENLFISGGGPPAVTAIDVDTAGLRRASYDVGYALAQLLIVSWMRTGSFRAGVSVALTFWDRWTGRGGTDAEAVPAEAARALVQSLHFELITYRTGRADLVQRWLGIAEAMLDNGVRGALESLAAGQEAGS